jgi:hypothetical protein
MNAQHRMEMHQDNGSEQLYVCPHDECGRRVVLHREGRLTVLEKGDFFAFHSGGTEGLGIGASTG